ncbi:phospholipase A2 [Streptomyces sp. DSM 41634]|uniref:phospholipase A2 n=1 Tax=Streptomyces sp. DSM 41634 TaxID=3448656 RepID=UPI002884FA0E|nr:phospholipase A2 [Streptomyces sp. DSM 41633]
MPQHDRQAPRGALTWWRRFHGAFRMLCLLAVGVVALGVAANAAPAKRQFHRASAAEQTITMEQIVSTGTAVYALASDDQGIYEWSTHQANWIRVFKYAAKNLYAGGNNLYATDKATGDIHKYRGTPDQWDRIGGPGLTFVATGEKVYRISPNNSGVWEYTGTKDIWARIGGPAKNIHASPAKDIRRSFKDLNRGRPLSTLYKTDLETGDLYTYDGKPDQWTKLGSPGATFAVTDKNLYRLNPDGTSVVERDPKSGKWNAVGGPASNIFSSNTLYKTEKVTGDLYKYKGKPGQWNRISGPAADFATSGDYLYRLSSDRRSVQKYNGNGATDQWLDLRAPVAPATKDEKIARLTALTQFGDDATNAWYREYGAYRTGKPDRYEFRWTNNKCNVPAPNSIGGYDFTLACIRHDFGYRNYRDLFGEEAFRKNPMGQQRIDQILLQDLNQICNQRGFPRPYTDAERTTCKGAANSFFLGVTVAPYVGM